MRRALSLLLFIGGLVAVAPTAHAAGGSFSSASGVLYNDCRQHPYNYSVDVPAGTRSWSVDVVVLGPDGIEAASDFIFDDSNAPVGTSSFQVCGGELPGTWTMTGTLEYSDQDFNSFTTAMPSATFNMRLPHTRTKLKVSDRTPRYNQKVTFKVRSRDERVTGYFPNQYAEVRLQSRRKGRWVNVRGSKTSTNGRGVAKISYKWNLRRSAKVRAVTVPTTAYASSRSKPVKIR